MNTHAQRPPWFDKWLGAGSPTATCLVEEAVALVAQLEHQTGARQRRRRPDDEANHRTIVEAIVSNLAYAVLLPHETGRLAVLTGKARRPRTRYDHPAFGDTFATVLQSLERIGWLIVHESPGMGEASTIAPTACFSVKVGASGIALGDFQRDVGETVVLSRKEQKGTVGAPSRELVDYPETPVTTALRGQMESVNAFLSGADITMLDDGFGAVDTFKRQQRRCFTSPRDDHHISHDRGGRMFGGWWSNLPKLRRGSIRIEGEPVTNLDYSSMFVRLAYARMGIEPPGGDLYAIPGFVGHRRAAKLIVNCLMFDEHERCRWPKVSAQDEAMPPGLTMPQARAAILAHHPELHRCFGIGLGHELMFTESTILMEVLLELKARRIVGLGLHDGLLIPGSRAVEVKALMEDVSRQITSHTIPATLAPVTPVHRSVHLSAPPYMRVVSSSRPSATALT